MNSHVHKYYRKFVEEELPLRLFHEVIPLHQERTISWDEIQKKAPTLPKGWFELCQLSSRDRIEFCTEFWLTALPFVPHVHAFLQKFFSELDDVGVYATQTTFEDPFEVEIVYSLGDGSCFFRGAAPCSERQIEQLKVLFKDNLPEEYLAFLRIHDGFSKYTDTGMIRAKDLYSTYRNVQELSTRVQCRGKEIDLTSLIPFYESFGLKAYQCFYLPERPESVIQSVFYSPAESAISDLSKASETLVFTGFLDWLVFYLEGIEV